MIPNDWHTCLYNTTPLVQRLSKTFRLPYKVHESPCYEGGRLWGGVCSWHPSGKRGSVGCRVPRPATAWARTALTQPDTCLDLHHTPITPSSLYGDLSTPGSCQQGVQTGRESCTMIQSPGSTQFIILKKWVFQKGNRLGWAMKWINSLWGLLGQTYLPWVSHHKVL